MVRTVCPGLCVTEFKYSAAPTRRITITTVGNGLPNNCVHQANWFYFLNPFISSVMCWCTWSLLFEDFDCRLSLIPQSYFFSLIVFILLILCLRFLYSVFVFHFIMMTMLLLCFAYTWVLIPLQVVLHLGISSPWNSLVRIHKNRLFTPL